MPNDGRIAVTLNGGAELRFRMSAENAAIAIANFVDNSARHGARRCALSADVQGRYVRIVAADDGDGISPNNRQRIFEPFFTTRRESGGTGLGLGIVAALVKAHDGSVRLAEVDHRRTLRDRPAGRLGLTRPGAVRRPRATTARSR